MKEVVNVPTMGTSAPNCSVTGFHCGLVTKPGPEQSPVYAFLTNGRHAPDWNFCKYLVGKDGKVIAFFPSKVTPESKELREAIETALR